VFDAPDVRAVLRPGGGSVLAYEPLGVRTGIRDGNRDRPLLDVGVLATLVNRLDIAVRERPNQQRFVADDLRMHPDIVAGPLRGGERIFAARLPSGLVRSDTGSESTW